MVSNKKYKYDPKYNGLDKVKEEQYLKLKQKSKNVLNQIKENRGGFEYE